MHLRLEEQQTLCQADLLVLCTVAVLDWRGNAQRDLDSIQRPLLAVLASNCQSAPLLAESGWRRHSRDCVRERRRSRPGHNGAMRSLLRSHRPEGVLNAGTPPVTRCWNQLERTVTRTFEGLSYAGKRWPQPPPFPCAARAREPCLSGSTEACRSKPMSARSHCCCLAGARALRVIPAFYPMAEVGRGRCGLTSMRIEAALAQSRCEAHAPRILHRGFDPC